MVQKNTIASPIQEGTGNNKLLIINILVNDQTFACSLDLWSE